MQKYKVLQVAALDVTVGKLLLPLIERLSSEGYEVHIACSDGEYVPALRAEGYVVHTIPIERRISPFSNLRSLWRLYRTMRRERFDIVHVHTPVAAALGRVAAWAARVPVVIYTAHGFYFHNRMPRLKRLPVMWVEKMLSRVTHLVFMQSQEDAATAVKERTCPEEKVLWIGNGVDVNRFKAEPGSNGFRAGLGLSEKDKVVGFVGRMVAEKGVLELIEAIHLVGKAIPEARLLFVGDTLNGDRDMKARQAIRSLLNRDGQASRVLFAGIREDIPAVMAAIDVFVLPSHREGMPRTVIEAMASGKPVVATDIRGCREEVLSGVTGLLVPVKDPEALASAIISVLSNEALARGMGAKGRQRACEHFDERVVIEKQVKAYAEITRKVFKSAKSVAGNRFVLGLKRAMDITASFISLVLLFLPFMVIAALIKLNSRGPAFFRQQRIGKDGKLFRVWKFRTMIDGAINKGLGVTVAHNDPRFTRVGRGLRNWGLDELPQLINVLRGEMSIVGPRPTLPYQVELYNNFQRQRLKMKPGITSLAVTIGRNSLSWKARIKFDVWYVTQRSLWLDVKIIFKTFWIVLVTRKGIYGENGVNDDFLSHKLVRQEPH